MIYVIISELIPTSHENKENSKFASFTFIIGFIIMMTLDIVLG